MVNSAGGIMIQETQSGYVATQGRKIPLYQRSRSCSLKTDTPEILAPVHLYNIAGPKFPKDDVTVFTPPPTTNVVYSKCINEYHIWLAARVVAMRKLSGIRGFISATGNEPSWKSTIDYFVPIDLFQSCNRDSLDNIAQEPSTITLLEKYLAFEDKVRGGHLGKTASLWFRVIEHTRLIIYFNSQ